MIEEKKSGTIDGQRGLDGLYQDIEYIKFDNGRVDWKKMISKEHLYKHPKYELIDVEIDDVPDEHKLVKLSGYRELAALRGFSSVTYEVCNSGLDYVSVKCVICWLPNLETDDKQVIFTSLGSATIGSTRGAFNDYLLEIAENRAFVRNVRNFLGINILCDEEINLAASGNSPAVVEATESETEVEQKANSPIGLLKKLAKKHKYTVEKINKLLEEIGAEPVEKIDLVSPKNAIILVDKINKIKNTL